jgi:hypothetical protein
MGWSGVWQLALKQFGAEAVEMRILILLLAAVVVLMVLVGLKHAFRSAEPRLSPPSVLPEPVVAAPPVARAAIAATEVVPVPQPVRVKMPMLRATRKCAKRTINRQRAPRPSIRRARLPSPAEIATPFTSLPRGGE